MDGDFNIVKWKGGHGLLNQRILKIFEKRYSKIDLDYIFYWLQPYLKKTNDLTAATTVKHLSIKDVSNAIVFAPNKHAQKKIAKILTTIDQLIEKTQALIDKHTAIKQGMMADLFTRGIDPTTGQLRPPVEKAPHLYKETELGWVPKEWVVSNIGECCVVSNNLRKPISAEEREKIKGDYPYYGCAGILDYINEFRVDGKYVIIGEDGDHFLKFSYQPMTILIAGKFNVNNHAHIISGTEICSTEWFHCYFVHRDITYYLTRQGAGRYKLKKETLLELPILLPSIEEQKEIFKRYSSINERQIRESTSLEKAETIKNGLMQNLLTGKVKVV